MRCRVCQKEFDGSTKFWVATCANCPNKRDIVCPDPECEKARGLKQTLCCKMPDVTWKQHIIPKLIDVSLFEKKENVNVIDKPSPHRLRIMSWNIQDLGGGFKGIRSDAVIDAIAKVIHGCNVDICVVLEVLKKKGFTRKKKSGGRKKKKAEKKVEKIVVESVPGLGEIKRILAALEKLDGKWTYATHPKEECTGSDSETYALIYKVNDGIEITDVDYVMKDQNGKDLGFPTPRHRRPMRAVARFSKGYGVKGTPWCLPIVAFHAPAQKTGDGQDRTPLEAFEKLATMALFDTKHELYTEGSPAGKAGQYVLAADLNINFDFGLGVGLNVNEQQWIYGQEIDELLEVLKGTENLGNEIAGTPTTLKQVSHHFAVEEYEEDDDNDMDEWMTIELGGDDFVTEEEFDALLGLALKGDMSRCDEECRKLAEKYEKTEDKEFLNRLASLVLAARDSIAEENSARLSGTLAAPTSTYAFCFNGFDRLLLLEQKPPVALSTQTWVFPLLAAVMPKEALKIIFPKRVPENEYGGSLNKTLIPRAKQMAAAMDGVLFKGLYEEFVKICKRFDVEPDIGNEKGYAYDTHLYLKLANLISDHLPLVMDIDYG